MKPHLYKGAIAILITLFSTYIIAGYIFEARADESPWQVQATERIELSREKRIEAEKIKIQEAKIADCMKDKLTKVDPSIEVCLGLQ